MQGRFHKMFYVIVPLAAIGFATKFEAIVRSLAIPIALVAILFVLYYVMQKRKPGRGKSGFTRQSAHKTVRQTRKPVNKPRSAARRTMPFQVIEGSKHRDDDEPPRYH